MFAGYACIAPLGFEQRCVMRQIAQQSTTAYLQKFHSSSAAQLPPPEAIQKQFLASSSKAAPSGTPQAAASATSSASSSSGKQADSNVHASQRLQLPWLRLAPPRLKPLPGEVHWLHPALPLDLLWDDNLSTSKEADQASILQGLFQQALQGPLLPAQQQQILDQLQSYPKRVFSCGMTPQKLPQLVELNPALAVEVSAC